jgi:DNA gyrase subunit B
LQHHLFSDKKGKKEAYAWSEQQRLRIIEEWAEGNESAVGIPNVTKVWAR